jgi:hypothetical protein
MGAPAASFEVNSNNPDGVRDFYAQLMRGILDSEDGWSGQHASSRVSLRGREAHGHVELR